MIEGFNYLGVMVDLASRFISAFELKTKTAKEVVTGIFALTLSNGHDFIHLTHDLGKEFQNATCEALLNSLRARKVTISPMTKNSILSELCHSRILGVMRKKYLHTTDWRMNWRSVIHTINISPFVLKYTQSTPYQLFYGRPPRIVPEIRQIQNQGILKENQIRLDLNKNILQQICEHRNLQSNLLIPQD